MFRNYNLFAGLSWLLIAVFFIVPLGQIGLFDDGVFYGCISRNLATQPSANAWELVVSPTLDGNFNGHPPFMFWVQSYFFTLLGDHFWIEKVFSFCCLLLSLLAIKSIWNLLLPNYKLYAYLPVFCWLLTPITWWSFGNNMLENLLTVLDLWAVFFIFKYIFSNKWLNISILYVIIILIAASLTKGPVGLYPLAVFATIFIIDKRAHFVKSSWAALLIVLGIVGFYAGLMAVSQPAKDFLYRYVELQISPSLSGQSAATSRFLILQKIVEENLILLALILISFFVQKWKQLAVSQLNIAAFNTFIFIALSATLPMMISPKQLGFYIVPALPLFGLAAAVLLLPMAEYLRRLQSDWRWFWRAINLGIIACFILFCINFGTIGRNKQMLADVQIINKKIAAHTVVRLQSELYKTWSLHGYLYRFGYINLICDDSRPYRYWLVEKNTPFTLLDYQKMELNTQLYDIWENKNIEIEFKK